MEINNYNFGKRSREQLRHAHPDFQLALPIALSNSRVDFGIFETFRPIKRQNQLFKEGKSQIDGINRKGKHNHYPSIAADIYIYHPDPDIRKKIAYDKEHLTYVTGIIECTFLQLYREGKVSHLVRVGSNWDMDGVIGIDQSFDDYVHTELIKPIFL